MYLISQLRPKESSDKQESPPEARHNGGVSSARGRPHALFKGVLVCLAEKHRDHVIGWFHHPDHPLTQHCHVDVLKVVCAKTTICDGPANRAPGDKGAPPSGICPTPKKAYHGPLELALYPADIRKAERTAFTNTSRPPCESIHACQPPNLASNFSSTGCQSWTRSRLSANNRPKYRTGSTPIGVAKCPAHLDASSVECPKPTKIDLALFSCNQEKSKMFIML